METVLPSRYPGVWLAGGRLPISASPPLERLLQGVERVASIRAEIGRTAKVATMPPVEIVPYIWTRDRALICGRVTALRQGDGAYFGVQLPAPTALCTDRAAVRALLVHEFAHWFYIATRAVNGSEFEKEQAALWICGRRDSPNRIRRLTLEIGSGKRTHAASYSMATRQRGAYQDKRSVWKSSFT